MNLVFYLHTPGFLRVVVTHHASGEALCRTCGHALQEKVAVVLLPDAVMLAIPPESSQVRRERGSTIVRRGLDVAQGTVPMP